MTDEAVGRLMPTLPSGSAMLVGRDTRFDLGNGENAQLEIRPENRSSPGDAMRWDQASASW
ncbi:hypothetical protein ACIHFD_23905 [Nonomuraea sp. NPDC051941]|uniref:hypothetical protein n=1 Tax=Nonomuraea sp. NPDC051941 TaxID=3364373 RepID=UPI0037C6A306